MSKYDEATVLELGARGRVGSKPFELVGRTIVRSAGGGLWSEWTARFDDGRVGFLAEARGTFTLYFEGPVVPAGSDLEVGAPLDTGFVVVERGEATRVARIGETFEGPKTYRYVDLSSRTGESATLDYGERRLPRTFRGRRRSLSELGLRPRAGRARLLPAAAGKLPRGFEPVFAIGEEGALGGPRYRVIGAMGRSIRVEGERSTGRARETERSTGRARETERSTGRARETERYTWEEYLLFEPSQGLRWLVVSDGHWSLVELVEPGLVAPAGEGVKYDGERYEPWSEGRTRVEWALGEQPWEVAVGDATIARDYVCPPFMLSFEATDDEISWSRGTYLSPDAVVEAFGERALPKPKGRAPNQPRPSRRT